MDKPDLRRWLRQRRAQRIDPAQPAALAEQFALLRRHLGVPTGPGSVLAAFLPTRVEPDLSACLAAAASGGEVVLVPRTLPGRRMEWVRWFPGVALMPDRHDLFAPEGPAVPDPLPACSMLLLPALAVDHLGTRLGHGAGYYDRALAGVPGWPHGPLRVAVVHPADVLRDPLPREPHDAAVDAILTAAGWYRTDPARATASE